MTMESKEAAVKSQPLGLGDKEGTEGVEMDVNCPAPLQPLDPPTCDQGFVKDEPMFDESSCSCTSLTSDEATVSRDSTAPVLGMEITGVSRSGRVRKKPSKFMDYENIDIHWKAVEKETKKSLLSEDFPLEETEVRIIPVGPDGKEAEPGPSRSSVQNYFSCQHCGISYQRKSNLSRHIKKSGHGRPKATSEHARNVQGDERLYHCNFCDYITHTETRLHMHTIRTHTKDGSSSSKASGGRSSQSDRKKNGKETASRCYSCHHCCFKGTSKTGLSVHITHSHTKGCRKCTECEFTSATDQELWKHTEQFHSFQSCNICDFTTSDRSCLKMHMLRLHSRSVKCTFCPKAFRNQVDLKNHVRANHSGGNPHLCKLCSFTYTTPDELLDHEATVHGVTIRSCPHCDFKCTTLADLKSHSSVHGSVIDDVTERWCGQCDFKCVSLASMEDHLTSAHSSGTNDDLNTRTNDVTERRCGQCDFKCISLASMEDHLTSAHSSGTDDDFITRSCHNCDFQSSSLTDLKNHLILVHGSETNYCCTKCDFHTAVESHMVEHAKSHDVKTEYTCAVCKQCFERLQNYTRHLKTHESKRNIPPFFTMDQL